MADVVSSAGAALQAVLTGDLIKDLGQALATGSVTDAPASIQNTSSPLAISGTVTSQMENGGAVVQTAAGPVTLSFDKGPVLPQGTVTVLIQPGSPPTASIIGPSNVTPQAQIKPQAAAAQQTQQTQQTQAALPPLAVGQVLTATPLPAATPTVVPAGPSEPPPANAPPPVISPATSMSSPAIMSSVAVVLPSAVQLASAVAPARPPPASAYLAPTPTAPAIPLPGQDNAASQQELPVFPQPYLQQPPSQQATDVAIEGEEDLDELTPQANALAAQESVNQDSAPPLPYMPSTPVQMQAQAATPQSYLVVSVETPAQPSSQTQTAINGQAAPASSNPPAPSGPPGQTINATVIAQTQSGQPLLETSGGAMLVNQSVSATAIGTELVLQRLTPEQAAAQPQSAGGLANGAAQGNAAASPAPLNDVPVAVSRQPSWPALTQLLGTLDKASPEAAAFLRQAIPTMGSGFAQAFTSFLTRAGQPTVSNAAIPEALRVILASSGQASATTTTAALRSSLLQLGADLTTAVAKGGSAAAAPQSWHSYQVPMLTDYGLAMAQLFVRQQIDDVNDEAGRNKPGGSSTRFLVEISPSKLGPVQLDGLLRKDKMRLDRLDLIVRTEFAVPPAAGSEMEQLFQESLGATGMSGKLGFQTGTENFVLPSSGADPHYRGDI